MGFRLHAVLYTALYTAALAFANAAGAVDIAAIEALREGDMRKLVIHPEPRPVPPVPFSDIEGGTHALSDYRGSWVVLNFWATWCAPCRAEMPMLADLQRDLAAEGLEVVTIATGRNAPQAITRFFAEIGVDTLPLYTDARNTLARPMGVVGLPVTVILDPEGREVARMMGEAEWNGESAKAILRALMAGG